MFSKTVFDLKKVLFIEAINSGKYTLEPMYEEVIENFQQNWNEEETDFGAMYDQSFQSSISHRLWTGVDYFPKEMMMHFIENNAHNAREVIQDLFNENRDIIGRVSRFTYHNDELLAALRKANPTIIYRDHYHNPFVASLYLMLRFPAKYKLFLPEIFSKSMALLGARKVPSVIPIDNYFTIMRTMTKFLNEEELLKDRHCSAIEMMFWLTNQPQV